MNAFNTFALPVPGDGEYAFQGKTVSIPFKYIVTAAYLYMVIPIILFFLTWLKWYIGIPLAVILSFGFLAIIKSTKEANIPNLVISLKALLIILCLLTVWLYTTSYFFYQTWDYHYRNALFRDLCNYSWPLIYPETGNAFSYYWLQWLVPALVGKIWGFTMANITLLVWNIMGVFIAFLCFAALIRPKKMRHIVIMAVILIIWGGLSEFGYMWIDILGQGGYGLSRGFGWPDMYYGYGYQFTPNDALLSWVFNQTIVPWIATLLFLIPPKVSHFAFLGLCVLPFAPFPFVGLCVFFLVAFVMAIQKNAPKQLLSSIFSVQNICASISIFPVFLLYYKCNVASGHIGFYSVPDTFGPKHIVFLFVFYLLEFGIYAILIHSDYHRSALFGTVIVSLMICPHIQVGMGRDFCMRVSIPALFILMVLVVRFLIVHSETTKNSLQIVFLIIALTISGLGMTKELAAKIKSVRLNDWTTVMSDDVKTFSNQDWLGLENFLVPEPEKTVFFKYLAK